VGFRELDDREPEVLDVTDDRDELFQIDRFGDVAVGVQVVGPEDVFLGFGSGEYHNGNGFQFGVALDLCEDLAAVLPRQIQVQENEIGARRCPILALLP
jgi:hypothetical protein